MRDAHVFLQNLALVFCVAAMTTVLSHRLRLPVVFGYLIAGMIVGPRVPLPFLVDEPTVRTLSELGVILLMFSLGLEFRLGRVACVAATSGLAALTETSVMAGLGFVAARAVGWSSLESIFAGAFSRSRAPPSYRSRSTSWVCEDRLRTSSSEFSSSKI